MARGGVCRKFLSVLYQFQFAGDLGALERQGGMSRQQLLEKLHRALIAGSTTPRLSSYRGCGGKQPNSCKPQVASGLFR